MAQAHDDGTYINKSLASTKASQRVTLDSPMPDCVEHNSSFTGKHSCITPKFVEPRLAGQCSEFESITAIEQSSPEIGRDGTYIGALANALVPHVNGNVHWQINHVDKWEAGKSWTVKKSGKDGKVDSGLHTFEFVPPCPISYYEVQSENLSLDLIGIGSQFS